MSNKMPESLEELQKIKVEREIASLKWDWIKTIVVPIIVALASVGIIWATGIFDARAVKQENADFKYQQDTTEFSKKRVLMYDSIASIRDSMKIVQKNFNALNQRYFTLEATVKEIQSNINKTDPVVGKLTLQNSELMNERDMARDSLRHIIYKAQNVVADFGARVKLLFSNRSSMDDQDIRKVKEQISDMVGMSGPVW